MWYSERGFNPASKLVFALPLSVGVESVCELLDVRVYGDIDYENLIRRLNDHRRRVKIYRSVCAQRKFKEIAYARYQNNRIFTKSHGKAARML